MVLKSIEVPQIRSVFLPLLRPENKIERRTTSLIITRVYYRLCSVRYYYYNNIEVTASRLIYSSYLKWRFHVGKPSTSVTFEHPPPISPRRFRSGSVTRASFHVGPVLLASRYTRRTISCYIGARVRLILNRPLCSRLRVRVTSDGTEMDQSGLSHGYRITRTLSTPSARNTGGGENKKTKKTGGTRKTKSLDAVNRRGIRFRDPTYAESVENKYPDVLYAQNQPDDVTWIVCTRTAVRPVIGRTVVIGRGFSNLSDRPPGA